MNWLRALFDRDKRVEATVNRIEEKSDRVLDRLEKLAPSDVDGLVRVGRVDAQVGAQAARRR